MRRVVTGVGPDGRSTVISDGVPPVAFTATGAQESVRRVDGSAAPSSGRAGPEPGAAVVRELWALDAHPSVTTDDPTVALEVFDVDVPPAATKWILTEMGPGMEAPMHRTSTVDYGLVVDGEVELGLENGRVLLTRGDTVVVNGVEHSWRAGPNGCVLATVLVGLRAEERGPDGPGGRPT